MTQSHINAAISELQEAREDAEMGTSMMLQSHIERLRDVRDNHKQINDKDSNQK